MLLIISAVLPPGFWTLLVHPAAFQWVALCRRGAGGIPARAQLRICQRGAGAGRGQLRIMFRHLLPNAMVATLTFLPFILTGSITTLTSLDFLGFGLPPGSASLGELTRRARTTCNAPWLGFTGFFTIAIMLSLLIFIGEAVRDAFDPRKTFR
jgi:microcin C transport system permease protein